MTKSNQIKNLIECNNGVITTLEIENNNIHRANITKLLKKGYIIRIGRGIYAKNNNSILEDEMYFLQTRFKKCIYSHNTALYLQNLTDRVPVKYTITVPSEYNVSSFKTENIEFKYLNKNLIDIGIIEVDSLASNYKLKTYNLEATICHLIKDKNNIETEIYSNAIKKYLALKNKNINLLMEYAKLFKVEKKLTMYLEVML